MVMTGLWQKHAPAYKYTERYTYRRWHHAEMRDEAAEAATERLDSCCGGGTYDWPRFYTPRMERANFASR